MNVLIVVPWDEEYGGVASVVGNLALQLQRHGHHVWFFHPGEPDTIQTKITKWNFSGYELNLRVPFIPDRPVKSPIAFTVYLCRTLRQLYSVLVERHIDIVNIHYPLSSFVYFALLRRLLRFKLVISVHGTDLLPKGEPEDRYSRPLCFLMNSADLLVAPSQSMLEDVLTKFPRLRTKALAFHNAVNMTEFEPSRSTDNLHQKYILCIAAHHPRKAIDVLIQAFKTFSSSHDGVELWLVGDGPVRGQLEELVHRLGVTDQVKFLGSCNRAEVKRLVHQCSLFVLPSRAEPFGIAILEALASKKPVVASAVGGIPEIIENGKNGILVEPENPQALCDAMQIFWDDHALGERLACAGYETVKQHFQWETAGARYEAAFGKLLGQAHCSTKTV